MLTSTGLIPAKLALAPAIKLTAPPVKPGPSVLVFMSPLPELAKILAPATTRKLALLFKPPLVTNVVPSKSPARSTLPLAKAVKAAPADQVPLPERVKLPLAVSFDGKRVETAEIDPLLIILN